MVMGVIDARLCGCCLTSRGVGVAVTGRRPANDATTDAKVMMDLILAQRSQISDR